MISEFAAFKNSLKVMQIKYKLMDSKKTIIYMKIPNLKENHFNTLEHFISTRRRQIESDTYRKTTIRLIIQT